MTEQDPLAHKRALMARIQMEGTTAAYEALLAVCRDGKAPAPARATSATTLFRAAGYLESKQANPDKAPEDMTAGELAARIRELRSAHSGPGQGSANDNGASGGADDVFG